MWFIACSMGGIMARVFPFVARSGNCGSEISPVYMYCGAHWHRSDSRAVGRVRDGRLQVCSGE